MNCVNPDQLWIYTVTDMVPKDSIYNLKTVMHTICLLGIMSYHHRSKMKKYFGCRIICSFPSL